MLPNRFIVLQDIDIDESEEPFLQTWKAYRGEVYIIKKRDEDEDYKYYSLTPKAIVDCSPLARELWISYFNLKRGMGYLTEE